MLDQACTCIDMPHRDPGDNVAGRGGCPKDILRGVPWEIVHLYPRLLNRELILTKGDY